MISYERNVLERQSLSELKMGRDSPQRLCERVCKKMVEYFKKMFLKIKWQRLGNLYHLYCTTYSKDSEKLEMSLCARDKAEDLYWMPLVFGPSDSTALLSSMIVSLALLNRPRNTSRNHPFIFFRLTGAG